MIDTSDLYQRGHNHEPIPPGSQNPVGPIDCSGTLDRSAAITQIRHEFLTIGPFSAEGNAPLHR